MGRKQNPKSQQTKAEVKADPKPAKVESQPAQPAATQHDVEPAKVEPQPQPAAKDDVEEPQSKQGPPPAYSQQNSSFGDTLRLLTSMKNEFKELEHSLLFMHNQASNKALLNGQSVETEFQMIRKLLKDVEIQMKYGMEEIELLFDNTKKKTLKEALRQRILTVYGEVIDEAVRDQVAACLAVEIPQELQDELSRTKTELDEVQRQLHNSQSQAANGLLRIDENETMHTIYTTEGQIHAKFPKTLQELFGLDDATIRELLQSYEISDISDDKKGNLNRFIQFCGVEYRMDDDDQVKLADRGQRE